MKKLEKRHGGALPEAQALKTAIRERKDYLTVKGQVIYVSEKGNDSNSGTSASEPIRTITRLRRFEVAEGDAVLFERNGIYRTEETFKIKSGVAYGAYGEGSKPVICGSVCNYAKSKWVQTEHEKIWKTTVPGEAGIMTFENDSRVGVRKFSLEELENEEEYFHDLENQILYMYAKSNPSKVYEDIEIGTTKDLLEGFHANNVRIQNLSLKYTANHAISLGDNTNVEITGCEVGWIGGKLYNEKTKIRLGNGIQIWNQCEHVRVDHCYIYQVYDAAFTFQGHYPEGNSYIDVEFTNNLVEYCSMNFEFWGSDNYNGNQNNGDLVEIRDILCKNNILRYAGYGWGGIQRPDKGDQAFLLGWNYTYQPGKVSNFMICDNIFDCADCYFVWSNPIFELKDNTYYQMPMSGSNNFNEVKKETDLYATDQASFEKGIEAFDQEAKTIKWLQSKGGEQGS